MSDCDYCQHVEMCGWRKEVEEQGCEFFDDGNNKWIPVSQPPKKAGKYIVTMRCLNRDFVDIASYAKDLYEVDHDDFPDKKGVAGWYGLDLVYGFYEHDFVTAWQDAPEPYKAEREVKG